MRVVLLVGMFGLLAACAQQIVWLKPGVTQAEFLRDEYECQRAAAMVPPGPGMVGEPGFAQGWNLGATMAREEEAERLYLLCMMARGYRLQE